MSLPDLRRADTARLAALIADSFDPAYGEAWNQSALDSMVGLDSAQLVVREADGRLIGMALARTALDEAELLLMCVSPAARGRGLGRVLVQDAIDRARQAGARRMFLEVRDGNTAAAALYGAAGFTPIGRRTDYYIGSDGQKYDAITMRRLLGS